MEPAKIHLTNNLQTSPTSQPQTHGLEVPSTTPLLNSRRFLSIEPTAMYFASGPNFTEFISPAITIMHIRENVLPNI